MGISMIHQVERMDHSLLQPGKRVPPFKTRNVQCVLTREALAEWHDHVMQCTSPTGRAWLATHVESDTTNSFLCRLASLSPVLESGTGKMTNIPSRELNKCGISEIRLLDSTTSWDALYTAVCHVDTGSVPWKKRLVQLVAELRNTRLGKGNSKWWSRFYRCESFVGQMQIVGHVLDLFPVVFRVDPKTKLRTPMVVDYKRVQADESMNMTSRYYDTDLISFPIGTGQLTMHTESGQYMVVSGFSYPRLFVPKKDCTFACYGHDCLKLSPPDLTEDD